MEHFGPKEITEMVRFFLSILLRLLIRFFQVELECYYLDSASQWVDGWGLWKAFLLKNLDVQLGVYLTHYTIRADALILHELQRPTAIGLDTGT